MYRGPGRLELEEMDEPVAAQGEVLIEVEAAGVCGTDRHLVAGELKVPEGLVPGHETAGRIAAVGSGVEGWDIGDPVVTYGQVVCGICAACAAGRQNRCAHPEGFGMARQGGFAELLTAPVGSVLHRPAGVSAALGAVATDAIATPFHALSTVARVRPGETVVIVGAGGLGLHGVLLARLMGAGRIVAVDPSDEARQAALLAGADEVFDPGSVERPDRVLRALAGGASAAFEFVGRAETVELALHALAPGGRLVIVGVGHDQPVLPPIARFIGMELSVHGSFGSTPAEIETVLSLIAAGRLDVSRSVTAELPLEDGPGVLAQPGGPGRTVLRPQREGTNGR
ncbi:MAG: alcohol dehydrogenase [Acidimicrobiales bacterium]|nr:MAG: zinc-binding dehydrogenase [Actinomycetota bacterium]MBV6507231.1 alcohol dehydrogenase [Acidimicrobiales bacterium]RIK05487.1 MAG: zinc-binding dehydrogenase [Acidobacteriota bacterium]